MNKGQKKLLEQIVPDYVRGLVPVLGIAYTESTVLALLDALAACREDAERYRLLRTSEKFDVWGNYPMECVDGNALDAAIDAARGGDTK